MNYVLERCEVVGGVAGWNLCVFFFVLSDVAFVEEKQLVTCQNSTSQQRALIWKMVEGTKMTRNIINKSWNASHCGRTSDIRKLTRN